MKNLRHDDNAAPRLRLALPESPEALQTSAGGIQIYGSAAPDGVPLLLIHSINAAASAFEVRPLYLHYRGSRPVYAIDLPGFGLADRPDKIYTPEVMVAAIAAAVDEVRRRHGNQAIDCIALSLCAVYLARVAIEKQDCFRMIGLIAPVGFDAKLSGKGPPNGNRGKDALHSIVALPLWRRKLFDVLVSRPSMRFFLQKTFGSKDIDEGLLDYGYVSAHQPGAEHAPLCFVAGYLFPTDATRLYRNLKLPVWVLHGTRGDFSDYSRIGDVADLPNWRVDVLPTGALPQFEVLDDVVRLFEDFARSLPPVRDVHPAEQETI